MKNIISLLLITECICASGASPFIRPDTARPPGSEFITPPSVDSDHNEYFFDLPELKGDEDDHELASSTARPGNPLSKVSPMRSARRNALTNDLTPRQAHEADYQKRITARQKLIIKATRARTEELMEAERKAERRYDARVAEIMRK